MSNGISRLMSPPPGRRAEDATLRPPPPSGALAARRAGYLAGLTAVALGAMLLSLHFFTPKVAVVSCTLAWAMLAIAHIDARSYTIPDALSLPAIPLGLLASGNLLVPWSDTLVAVDHVLGAGLGGAGFWLVREAYFRLRGREGLGLGDVKLAAAAGAWTGWQDLPNVVLLAAAAALTLALARAVVRRSAVAGTERIAFGAFLAPAIWIVWTLRRIGLGL